MRSAIITGAALLLMSTYSLKAQDNDDCLTCHSDPELKGMNKRGQEVSMFVAEPSEDSSVHAGMSCVD